MQQDVKHHQNEHIESENDQKEFPNEQILKLGQPAISGRAYGMEEVLIAWAAEIQKERQIALYSTAWNNLVSQAEARKLKLSPGT